jgi:hypothetical protein
MEDGGLDSAARDAGELARRPRGMRALYPSVSVAPVRERA